MKKILELIEEKTNELELLYNSIGLNIPMIEDRNRLRICILENELETLNSIVLSMKEEHQKMKDKIADLIIFLPEYENEDNFKKYISLKDLSDILKEYKIGGIEI